MNNKSTHNWHIIYTEQSEEGPIFGFMQCSNCNISGICAAESLNEKPEKIIILGSHDINCDSFLNEYEKSITHDWFQYRNSPEYYYDFKCSICEMMGFKYDYADTSLIIGKNLYTCNEWLMIKANE